MTRSLLGIVVFVSLLWAIACGGGSQPTGAPAPATATSTGNDQQVIAGLEHQWVAAILAKDVTTIDRLLADDFSGTTADVTYGKAEALEDVRAGTHEMLDLSDIVVRVYGDAAVAAMNQTEKSQHAGKDFSGHYLFTNVWIRNGGQWRSVASHGSRIR